MSKLFEPSPSYKPFAFPFAVETTQSHERVHWIEDEADLSGDVSDWKSGGVNAAEMNFITQILRLFTQSDVNVGAFYYEHLIPRFRNNEVRLMLGSFANREGTHQRAYSLLNETLGLPESDYHVFLEYAAMADKHEHMLAADNRTNSGLLLALAKGVNNEGISLFASFAMLLNFQRIGKMTGMGKIVEWSQRDESIHVEGLSWLFRTMARDYPQLVTPQIKEAIYDMVRRTVDLEDSFVDLAFEMGGIEGLTADEVKAYVRYIADRRLTQLGLKENWGAEINPLPWIDWLVSGADHTNFFEGKVTEYEVGSLEGDWGYPLPKPSRDLLRWTVYSKPDCPHCDTAKQALTAAGETFVNVPITGADERAAFFTANNFHGVRGPYGATMPKIYEVVNSRLVYVGGAAELAALLAERR